MSVYTAQHYLTHLLREKLVASKSRVVVVSSGAIRMVSDACKSYMYPKFLFPLATEARINKYV